MIVFVTDEHDVALARRAARAMAYEIGFGGLEASYLATGVSALAADLLLHASLGGVISFVVARQDGQIGIEVVSEGRVGGTSDIAPLRQDQVQQGAGQARRLPDPRSMMDEFEVTVAAGAATRIVARKWRTVSQDWVTG